MKEQTRSAILLLEALTERAKELTCLYAIEETLKEPDAEIEQVCERIVREIPPGWQFPNFCVAQVTLEGRECHSPGFKKTPWKLSANIVQQDQVVGTIDVYYTKEMPAADIGPFLKEENKLIVTIADRLNHFLTYKKMKHVFQEWQNGGRELSEKHRGDWEAVLDLIRQTDNALFLRISNKMLNHLCWTGISEAEELRRSQTQQDTGHTSSGSEEIIEHQTSRLLNFSTEFTERIFRLASQHLGGDEILSRIQMWIQEDRLGALLRTVRRQLPLSAVHNALRRYFITTHENKDEPYPLARGLKVLLIESILSNRMEYINLAKDHLDIEDLFHLLQKVVFSPESHGRIGGKSANLFLADQILKKTKDGGAEVSPIRTPKTRYIASDVMLQFIHYNNMDEVIEQKYKELERVRLEYPHVLDIFRQTVFPPEIVKELSMVLDDFGARPLVVRSSSLLEDRTGSAFANKYKTLFLGNQGTREERLQKLMQAVAEVYASNFGPDPIEYRAEHGLLELSEQMGVMIQEVVGTRIGPFFLPAYSGVARSRNNFRWSAEIEPKDGIAYLAPGLGTRAPDRASNEYPVVVVPGCPSMKLNRSAQDWLRHSPKKIDVINLETNRLQTIDLDELLRYYSEARAIAELMMSVYKGGQISPLDRENPDFESDRLVVTFDALVCRSPFVLQLRNVLRTLEKTMGKPVEIEFASDGEHFYLLQCRTQPIFRAQRPAPIPRNTSTDKILFSANRSVSNGQVANITHVVYLNPAANLVHEPNSSGLTLGQALSRLNRILPKRQFAFIGPGGLAFPANGHGGLSLKYSDINNAAVLVELIKQEEGDRSVLCFGPHLLHDLAESDIHYVSIFLADKEATFNENLLTRAPNLLLELLPELASFSTVLRVTDISRVTGGNVLQVLMNAELEEAVGLLTKPNEEIDRLEQGEDFESGRPENYWRWRYSMAEKIASHLDPARFGVEGIYLFGSTKNGTAGPASDIDILIHFSGTNAQREGLQQWLDGWSLCLDEINYLRTGYRSGGLLDVHLVTDEDIAKRTSYASKINAITDAARPLKMKTKRELQRLSETNGLSIREGVN